MVLENFCQLEIKCPAVFLALLQAAAVVAVDIGRLLVPGRPNHERQTDQLAQVTLANLNKDNYYQVKVNNKSTVAELPFLLGAAGGGNCPCPTKMGVAGWTWGEIHHGEVIQQT